MGCDASTVSRIESSNDRHLKWTDIVGYASALNVQMSILFDQESLPAATRIKHAVFRIHADLEGLADLAKQVGGDDKISKKIHEFYGDVLLNFMIKFSDSAEQLPRPVKVTPNGASQRPKEERQLRDETPVHGEL